MEDIFMKSIREKNTAAPFAKAHKALHTWIRRILAGISLFFAVLLFLLLLGVFIPSIPYVGVIGTLLESFFSLHLVIASLIVGLLAYTVLRLGGKRAAILGLSLSIINVIGFCIPLADLVYTAGVYHTNISWSQHLTGGFSVGGADVSKSVQFTTTPDGKALFMDISKPNNFNSQKALTPVVLIHGGGFVAGTRNEEPAWTQFYNDRGYVVFDVDYRLATATYHTWDKAAPDIATAIVWIGNHAENYHVDMSKLIIAGASAGGGLALQVAYGIQDGTLKAYEPGPLAQAKAVVAIFPAQNMTATWNSTTSFLGIDNHQVGEEYIGGSPQAYPQAYATVDVSHHITRHSPPTIVIAGQHDHAIPYQSQVQFVDDLTKMGVPHELISIPFTDHFFVFRPGGISGQIAFQGAGHFLDTYAK
jgi:acetyl esterase/lipase